MNPLNRRQALQLAQYGRLGGWGDVDENGSPDLPGPRVFRELHSIARDDPVPLKPVKPRLHRGAREPQFGANLCNGRTGIRAQKREKSVVGFVKFDHNDESNVKLPTVTDKSCKVPSLSDVGLH